MSASVLLLTVLSLLSLNAVFCEDGEETEFPCTPGNFYMRSSQECVPCSRCAENELVKIPCQPYQDRKCGPFTEFISFRQTSDNSDTNSSTDGGQNTKTEVHLTIYRSDHGSSSSHGAMARNAVQTEDTEYWRKVAFAMIGALSALIFVASIVVLVTCKRICQPRRSPVRDGEDSDDAECPYVVIHTIRPSRSSTDDDVTYQVPPGINALHQLSRQRRRLYKYRPKRRLLPANEYADDVFESEDSAGSRRRISLQAIPENGQSDNEAETGSPRPSENTPLQAETEESEDKPAPEETAELLPSKIPDIPEDTTPSGAVTA